LDLLLFTSEPRAEGMPGVVLEACSHGLPVLARYSQSIEEIKDYYINISFIDENESACNCIKHALRKTNPDTTVFKNEFALERMTTRTSELYFTWLEKKGFGDKQECSKEKC
jgi:glycosyltransferase involved in cell wall biosynthesis